jgi:hypothetical protein
MLDIKWRDRETTNQFALVRLSPGCKPRLAVLLTGSPWVPWFADDLVYLPLEFVDLEFVDLDQRDAVREDLVELITEMEVLAWASR